ncbi:response regulator [Desulfocurvibacter africanus]|uniref:response regulator n=1 Tax=Desulfocurvibacter africanus TaxID=873 RepID=UPI002FDA91E4
MSDTARMPENGLRIMLVDDESPFIDALAKRLTRRGIKVSRALSGDEALERLAAGESPEVVVLDVKMPGMDGMQALELIKHRHPLVEVIMLTGHATVESAIQGMKLGAFDYLLKPCDLDELIRKASEAGAMRR